MKRIITLFLCTVFLCLSAVSASAGAYDLAEYGQKTVTLTYPMTPLIDGRIDEGEYEIAIKLVIDEDENDDNFFVNGNCSELGAEHVIVYITADDDNIYFAVEQKDPLRVSFHDAMYVQIGAGDRTDKYIQIYLPYHRWPEILTESNKDLWSNYYSGYAGSYTEDLTYYELAIPRRIIEEKFGVEKLDKLLVSVAQRISASEDTGNVSVMWGFKNSELEAVYKQQGFPAYGYPNVLQLYTNNTDDESLPALPEIVLPETESNEEQGKTEPEAETELQTETKTDTESTAKNGCKGTLVFGAPMLVAVLLIFVTCIKKQEKNRAI